MRQQGDKPARGDKPKSGESNGKERRIMARIDTLREVLYSRLNATGPLHEGAVVDMSSGGMRIRSRFPIDPGTELSIELQPKPNDDMDEVVMLHGRVVHVVEENEGEFAMGVKLILKSGSRRSLDYARIAATFQSGSPTASSRAISERSTEEIDTTSVRYHTVRPSRVRRRWRSIFGLFLLAALAYSFLPTPEQWQRDEPFRASGDLRTVARQTETSEVEVSASRSSVGAAHTEAAPNAARLPFADPPGLTTPAFVRDGESTYPRVGGASPGAPSSPASADPFVSAPRDGAFSTNDPSASTDSNADPPLARTQSEDLSFTLDTSLAAPAFDGEAATSAPLTRPGAGRDPGDSFRSQLLRAEEMAGRGEGNLALAVLDRALDTPAVSEAWRGAGERLRSQIESAKGAAVAGLGPMSERVDFDNDEPATTTGELEDIYLEIDRHAYVLRVMRDGDVLRSFPVGLGAGGATPVGEFRIANKITDPDWYNRGDVVPSGDPKNPLGSRWMGLGVDGTATSYGIHPTNDRDSIGENESRGCIRMWPEDAETLFRLCPLGTPVRISE